MSNRKPRKDACVIRQATESDLPMLVGFQAKLALHVLGQPVEGDAAQSLKEHERDRLTKALQNTLSDANRHLAVAEVTGAGLVGMGYIYIWKSQGIWEQTADVEYRSGVIDDVWVEPEYRGQGIMSAILRDLVAFAEQKGAAELILEYSASNREAKAAWTRLGFKTTGVRAAAFTSTVKEALGAS